jgi:GNAT superfamily N-acetyltransferase
MSELTLHSPVSDQEWERYFDLRWRVLRAPWSQPRGSERDDLEGSSFHAALWDDEGRPAAVGRLQMNTPFEAQVRFMAVDPAWARRGLGSRILAALEAQASELGASEVILNARAEAQPFYARHGYRRTGPAATLFGSIPHDAMAKCIAPANTTPRRAETD